MQTLTNTRPAEYGVPTPLAASNPSLSDDWTTEYTKHLETCKGYTVATDVKLDLRAMQSGSRRPIGKASAAAQLLPAARR